MAPQIERRLCCGCSTSLVLFAMGGVSLVYASIDIYDHKDPTCGLDGKPPLRDWLFGTGISFIAIAASFTIASKKGEDKKVGICDCIAALSNLFLLAWAIVGAITLSRADDCEKINQALFRCSYAAVVTNWVVCCCGMAVVYESGTDFQNQGGEAPTGEQNA